MYGFSEEFQARLEAAKGINQEFIKYLQDHGTIKSEFGHVDANRRGWAYSPLSHELNPRLILEYAVRDPAGALSHFSMLKEKCLDSVDTYNERVQGGWCGPREIYEAEKHRGGKKLKRTSGKGYARYPLDKAKIEDILERMEQAIFDIQPGQNIDDVEEVIAGTKNFVINAEEVRANMQREIDAIKAQHIKDIAGAAKILHGYVENAMSQKSGEDVKLTPGERGYLDAKALTFLSEEDKDKATEMLNDVIEKLVSNRAQSRSPF